jgi:hypothetical protein
MAVAGPAGEMAEETVETIVQHHDLRSRLGLDIGRGERRGGSQGSSKAGKRR